VINYISLLGKLNCYLKIGGIFQKILKEREEKAISVASSTLKQVKEAMEI